jgi:hypothetical protein
MKAKTTLLIAALSLVAFAGNAYSQTRPEGDKVFAEQAKELSPKSPESIAQAQADRMDEKLELSKKQYKKIYKIYLSEAKTMQKEMQNGNGMPQMGGRPMGGGQGGPMGGGPGGQMGGGPGGQMGGGPMGGGQGGPMGGGQGGPMGGGQGQPGTAKNNSDAQKRMEKMNKKIKKVLTETQYTKWEQFRKERPERPLDQQKKKDEG